MSDEIEVSLLNLVMIGASGHAHVVAEAVELSNHVISGYLAPEPLLKVNRLLHDYLGNDDSLSELVAQNFHFCIGMGFVNAAGATRRRQLLDRLPWSRLPVIRHPSSVVSRYSNCEAGAFIAAGATVGNGANIGPGAIINTGSIVDHDSVIGTNTHVAIGAKIAGGVRIGENCLIGAGAVILQGTVVGSNAVIGAGAVVLRDVPNETIVFGNPARILRTSKA